MILIEPSPAHWNFMEGKIWRKKTQETKLYFGLWKKETYIRSADQNVTILPASIEFNLIFDKIIQCMVQFYHEFGSRWNAILIKFWSLFFGFSIPSEKTVCPIEWKRQKQLQFYSYRRRRCVLNLARGATPSVAKNNNFFGRTKRYNVSIHRKMRSKIRDSS